MRRALCFASASLLLCASAALAQEDGIVVTASRAPVALERVGQSVTVLSEADIAASQRIALADLLATTPGVQLRRNGGPGTATSLFVRGADNGQTLVLYDGVRLHDPSTVDGGASLADVTTLGLGRIEVLRGSQSVLYGSQALGGVINLLSSTPTAPLSARLQAEAGERDSVLLRGQLAGAGKAVTWRAAGGWARSDGISASSLGSEPDGYENLSLNGRVTYALSENGALDLRGYYSRGDSEFDGFAGDAANRALSETWLGYAGLSFRALGALDNRIAYARTDVGRSNRDESDPAAIFESYAASGRSDRVEYQGTLAPGGSSLVVFGAEYAENAFDDLFSPATAGDHTLGLYVQASASPLAGMTLTGGLRHEDHSTFGGHTVGAASLAYTPDDGATLLRASYSEGYKAPGLYQIYSADFGSRDLQPEEAVSWELGGERRLGDMARLSAVYFTRTTSNLVSFEPCSADPARANCSFGFYANAGRVEAEGVELGAELALGAFGLTANYSLLDARYAAKGEGRFGNRLARRAHDSFHAAASYTAPSGLALAASLSMVGASFDDEGNTVLVPGYEVVDLRASYPLGQQLELYARVENLFDATYETVRFYSSPPRTVYAGLRLDL